MAAFEFWTDKKVKILFEEEINKFLSSDLSSNIDGYDYGMIPLMIALINCLTTLKRKNSETQN